MTFVLKPRDTFKYSVTAELPTTDPNKREKVGFTAEFKYIDKAALKDLIARQLPDDDVVGEVLVSVDGVKDEQGQAVPFEVALTAIRNDITLSSATAIAFFEGIYTAKAKNSNPSPAR